MQVENIFRGLAVAAAALFTSVASAQTVGGHIGVVLPLVTHAGGQTTNDPADNFSIGFPFGVTFHGTGRTSLDFEFVPFVNTAPPRNTSLTVHPGVVWDVGHHLGVGVRAAFDVNSASYGFTPLVNYSWPLEHKFFKAYFIEGDLPVRFNRPSTGPKTNAVTFASHTGIAF